MAKKKRTRERVERTLAIEAPRASTEPSQVRRVVRRPKLAYEKVDRRRKPQPHPVFADDADVERMLISVYSRLFKFWPDELIRDDGTMEVPSVEQMDEILRAGGVDNDVRSTLEFYLQNFWPHEPEEKRLAELYHKVTEQAWTMDAEECRYVVSYIFGEHDAGAR